MDDSLTNSVPQVSSNKLPTEAEIRTWLSNDSSRREDFTFWRRAVNHKVVAGYVPDWMKPRLAEIENAYVDYANNQIDEANRIALEAQYANTNSD